jgi:hypothetical protein
MASEIITETLIKKVPHLESNPGCSQGRQTCYRLNYRGQRKCPPVTGLMK